jgi:DNA-binding transcriptional LysR family regulator
MIAKDLLKVDLNLLISLQVLLEERSVSRAAERLFITQPAMSKTLSRLRSVFDDPLFTRSSHGMLPTPRALALGDDLSTILHDIQQLVNGPGFDPASHRGEVTIALSEYIGVWLLPRLMGKLQLLAPGVTIKSITRIENQLQQLASGDLDIAIHIKHAHYGDEYICQPLGGSAPIILAREAHPLSGLPMTWDQIMQYPMIRLYISDQEELEVFQKQQDVARRIESQRQRGGWFETSHLLTALEVLRNTDYLMPGPPFLLGNPTVSYKIQALPMPADADYQLEYMLVRHRRTQNSDLHNWLWQQVLEVLELRDIPPATIPPATTAGPG